jgi:hypothetical protein
MDRRAKLTDVGPPSVPTLHSVLCLRACTAPGLPTLGHDCTLQPAVPQSLCFVIGSHTLAVLKRNSSGFGASPVGHTSENDKGLR